MPRTAAHSWKLTTPPALVFIFVVLLAASPPAQSAPASPSQNVTLQLAAEHLFASLADGPNAPSWAARTSALKNNGFTSTEIERIVMAADECAAATYRLTSQAIAIHQNLKSKSVDTNAAVQQLKSLDQQRDAQLEKSFNDLEGDLGPDGRYKLEKFLNEVVKPTITMVSTK